VASEGVRREECREGADYQGVGPAASNPAPPCRRRLPHPLRLELDVGGRYGWSSDADVAGDRGSVLQREAGY